MSSSVGNQVRASHILIKHHGSRRKASWKDPEGQIIRNTTQDSAISQLKALHDEILSGKAKFDDLASRYSDCSSAKRGGDLEIEEALAFSKAGLLRDHEDRSQKSKRHLLFQPCQHLSHAHSALRKLWAFCRRLLVPLAGTRCRNLLKKQHLRSRLVR